MSCPICGGGGQSRFPAKYVVAARCDNPGCGHLWAIDVRADAGVQLKAHPEKEAARFRVRNRDLARLLATRGFLRPGFRLLDLGAGVGHILAALREAVEPLDVVAVEPDVQGLARLREQGFVTYSALAEVPNLQFNSVTMIEVIEHVADPLTFLVQVRNRMAKNAMVFFTTPVGETRFGSRDTNAYDTPEHVHFFTEKSLALAFQQAGFVGFRLETINEMTGALTPGFKGRLKNIVRPVRAKILGHHHLTGFASTQ